MSIWLILILFTDNVESKFIFYIIEKQIIEIINSKSRKIGQQFITN